MSVDDFCLCLTTTLYALLCVAHVYLNDQKQVSKFSSVHVKLNVLPGDCFDC